MKKGVGVIVSVIALSIIVSALAGVQSEQLKKSYIEGDVLSGKIFLNLTNESTDSLIRSNIGGNISLISLLNASGKTEGIDYECDIAGCRKGYISANTFSGNMDVVDEFLFGFKLTGKSLSVQSVDFSIASDAADSDSGQIDLYLPKREEPIQNPMHTDSFSGNKNYGCFDSQQAGQNRFQIIPEPGLCEKINLPDAPALNVGAKVMNTTGDVRTITMQIYNNLIESIGECNLPSLNNQEEEVSCIVEMPIKHGDYYVCVSAPAGDYKIRAESSGDTCGTAQLGSEELDFDYEIFARPMRYASPYIQVKNDTRKQTSQEIEDYVNEYLSSFYNNDCAEGCVVPFKIRGFMGNSQTISISNPKVIFLTQGNIGETSDLHRLNPQSAKISGENVELEMAYANITLLNNGSQTISLFIGDKTVLSNIKINVSKGFGVDIVPKFALIGVPTVFRIISTENISRAIWNFGDGSTSIEAGNILSHTYSSKGNYSINLKLTNSKGISVSRDFLISAENLNESLRILKNESENHISKVKAYFASLPAWMKLEIESKLNITSKEQEYRKITSGINSSLNDTEKINVIGKIIALNIPVDAGTKNIENLPLAVGFSAIETGYIENISSVKIDSDKKRELADSIIYWMNNNYASLDILKREISYQTGAESISLGSLYSVSLNKKSQFEGDVFFIIDYPEEQVVFPNDYQTNAITEEGRSATYLNIKDMNTIEFYISDETDAEDLGMYISPNVGVLGNYEKPESFIQRLPIGWLIFWIVLLVIGFFGAYIYLQEWYKKNYETHLFRNKDDLFNLLAFISNSRQSGMKDEEIKKKLSSMRWSGEQIIYGFKKIDGKRVGMWEIPLFRSREQKKIREEMEKRKQNRGDARFIKRQFI